MDEQFIQTKKIVTEQARLSLSIENGSGDDWFQPAATLLLDDDSQQYEALVKSFEKLAGTEASELCDELGHRREIYFPFALHLHLSAMLRCKKNMAENLQHAGHAAAARAAKQMGNFRGGERSVATELWSVLCMEEARACGVKWDAAKTREQSRVIVQNIFASPGRDGSLHPLGEDESLDRWTYHELCALHALWHLRDYFPELEIRSAARRAAMHHNENTQPDNTTTQPWGLPAFLSFDDTLNFAQQQLHDITMSSVVSGRKGRSMLIGAILADAAAGLSGR